MFLKCARHVQTFYINSMCHSLYMIDVEIFDGEDINNESDSSLDNNLVSDLNNDAVVYPISL